MFEFKPAVTKRSAWIAVMLIAASCREEPRVFHPQAVVTMDRGVQAIFGTDVVWTSTDTRPDGTIVRVGTLDSDASSMVILSVQGEAVQAAVLTGSCRQKCSTFEPVTPGQRPLFLKPADYRRFQTDGFDRFDLQDQRGSGRADLQGFEAPECDSDQDPCATETDATITAVVAYTPAALEGLNRDFGTKGDANMIALIHLAEEATNQAFMANQLDARFQVLTTPLLNIEEDKSLETTFQKLLANEELCELRNRAGADVAFVIVEVGTGAGHAGLLTPEPDGRDEYAYGVIRWDHLKCNWTLTHELGHLIGACHDPQSKTACSEKVDLVEFNQGHIDEDEKWRTVMGDGGSCSHCARLLRWSTPAETEQCDGKPVGTASQDNARWISEKAKQVARFRCTAAIP